MADDINIFNRRKKRLDRQVDGAATSGADVNKPRRVKKTPEQEYGEGLNRSAYDRGEKRGRELARAARKKRRRTT